MDCNAHGNERVFKVVMTLCHRKFSAESIFRNFHRCPYRIVSYCQ